MARPTSHLHTCSPRYSPFLPLIPFTLVTVNSTVLGLEQIYATSAVIESTSLVVSQGLDLFFSRVTPSKTFDLLAADFNRPMLILMLAGLASAAYVTKGMDRRKKVRWELNEREPARRRLLTCVEVNAVPFSDSAVTHPHDSWLKRGSDRGRWYQGGGDGRGRQNTGACE